MRMFRFLLFCLFISIPLALRGQQPASETGISAVPPPDSFFIDKEKEVWEALKHNDKAADSRLLADDFVGLYDTGFATKSDHVKQMDDKDSIGSYNLQDAKVLHLSPEMALLLYKATCKGSGEWEEFCSLPKYVSSLWAVRSGQWVALFSQDTTTAANEQEISAQALAKEREIQEAQKRNDSAQFADLLSDDLVAIDEDGIRGKKELLEEIRTSDFRLSDYKMEDVKTIPEGDGVIIAYKQTHVGTEHGKPFALRIYTHSNWQRRGDKWVLTMFQDSTAKEDTAADSGEQDDASVLKEILASEYRIVDALARDDIEGFAKLLPEDVMDIDDDGIHTKTEWIREFQEQKARGFVYREFRFDDPKLIRLGADQATMAAKETMRGLDKGKPFEVRTYTNATYVRRDGKWVPRVYQDTPMVE